MRIRTRRTDDGAVTAEAAMMVPVLAAVALAMAWLITVGTTHVRAVDAARETARSLARGDPRAVAAAWGRRVAVDGSTIDVRRTGKVVRVRVTSPVEGPGGLFGFLHVAPVHAEAVTRAEPS